MKNVFLSLLNDAKKNEKSKLYPIDYNQLFLLSNEHQVSALIYNQIYSFPDFPSEIKNSWRREALKINAFQTIRTERFLKLYQKLLDHHLHVIVVKGIICRNLYPQPDNRQSNDEDLYVQQEELEDTINVFLSDGFNIISASEDVTTFVDSSTGLSIELHTALFSKDSDAYGNYQNIFDNAFETMITHSVQGTNIYSLSHDLHLLFLIMHLVKHFLHGGVGIRQVLDIVMYCEKYGNQIEWNFIYQTLQQFNLMTLIMNVFSLAHDYFDFDYDKIILPNIPYEIDYQDLLNDIMEAGIFGKSSEERLHSSTITLNAMNEGKRSLVKSVFPSRKEMEGKFEYLVKYPFLLPTAYISRIYHYFMNNDTKQAQKAIDIGNQRIELLKKYKIIK